MKSLRILSFACVAMFGFVACGSNCNKTEAAAADSTAVVAVDSTAAVVADSTAVADTVAAE